MVNTQRISTLLLNNGPPLQIPLGKPLRMVDYVIQNIISFSLSFFSFSLTRTLKDVCAKIF